MSPATLFASQSTVTQVLKNSEFKFRVNLDDPSDTSLVWQQINDIFNKSVARTGFQREITQEAKKSIQPHVLVAPGILVPGDEYKKRFGTIDLEEYRRKMSPGLFRVFVKHIGSISGMSKLDIQKLLSNPED